MKSLIEKLSKIQSELKAPKNQYNKFGNYSYRSCEDLFNAVKEHLKEHKLVLTVNDELVLIGDRYYIKATATISDGENTISNNAYAREEESKKGMDCSQITGSTSSYARKYALNGLFLIDDVKDADSTNQHEKGEKTTDNDRIELISKINDLENELEIPHEKILETYKVKSNNQMTVFQLTDCIKNLEDLKKKRG